MRSLEQAVALPQSALPLVLDRLPPMEAMRCRIVSKTWDEIISQANFIQNVMLTVVGNNAESIQAFRSLSPMLEVKHFRFLNLDLNESELLGNPQTFSGFRQNLCPRVETLYLENCRLSTDRFFDLISICPSLKCLGIRGCPSIYQPNIGIIYSGFCPTALRSNLSGLTTLKLAGRCIAEVDLSALSTEMKSLKSVHIGCKDGFLLPRVAILNLMKNNCDSLEELTLVGRMFGVKTGPVDNQKLEDLPRMTALTSLAFLECHFTTFQQTRLLDKMFHKCPNLSRFRTSMATLFWGLFPSLQFSLTELELCECSTCSTAFVGVNLNQLRKVKVTPRKEEFSTDFEESIVTLLGKDGKPRLETLHIQLAMGGKEILDSLKTKKFPKLTSLTLSGFTEISGGPLRLLFNKFPELTSFALTNCEEVVDSNLCPTQDGSVKGSIANLKKLRSLNLTRTSVGNRTLKECVLQMKHLESLRLDGTKVDKQGLVEVFIATENKTLPSFNLISVTGCDHCRLTPEEIRLTQAKAPQVRLACSMDISQFMIAN